jgi:hypothetical protein
VFFNFSGQFPRTKPEHDARRAIYWSQGGTRQEVLGVASTAALAGAVTSDWKEARQKYEIPYRSFYASSFAFRFDLG